MIPVSSAGMRVPVRVPVDPLVEDPLVSGDHRAASVERPGVGAARRVQVVPEHQRQGLLPDGQAQLGEHGPSAGDGRPEVDHRSCQPRPRANSVKLFVPLVIVRVDGASGAVVHDLILKANPTTLIYRTSRASHLQKYRLTRVSLSLIHI